MSTSTATSASSGMSFLSEVPVGPPDAILGIAQAFRECTDPNKVNICVGAYRDENGSPWVLPSVRAAERKMIETDVKKEYAPIDGDQEFVKLALQFAYGADLDYATTAAVQTLSGTGACRIGGEFFGRFLGKGHKIYLPNPTWGNHVNIFKDCGLDVQRYRYYSSETNGLDLAGMLEDLKNAPEGSVILLHACAHNPTGCDPTLEQWKEISDAVKAINGVVFFDSAYQGFASGDAELDAAALRLFVSEGHKVTLAQSFAKNFGLYGERCGTLSILTNSAEEKAAVMSQLKLIIRPMYSSPPIHGSGIVKTALSDDALRAQYYAECAQMAKRIGSMRTLLVQKLKEAGSEHDWSHVTDQIGMFAFTGMSKEMVQQLTAEYSIFMTLDGRISLAGLNDGNVEYVAKAVHSVTEGKSICG
eukprot:CAMPEP_0116031340 /NCGR_PEP_ID=MMETSP0321-20121206/17451_1 /TAXON_ID=163516 /ORGANISM="Leptocylindrus danicus var. danicus, Strain B650" /LENGTH=416 /DNA_ID=CAMNT_0003506437 /DNA_START=89 /DNA_END=1339 /DNA_ORIENTATION=-